MWKCPRYIHMCNIPEHALYKAPVRRQNVLLSLRFGGLPKYCGELRADGVSGSLEQLIIELGNSARYFQSN